MSKLTDRTADNSLLLSGQSKIKTKKKRCHLPTKVAVPLNTLTVNIQYLHRKDQHFLLELSAIQGEEFLQWGGRGGWVVWVYGQPSKLEGPFKYNSAIDTSNHHTMIFFFNQGQ